MHRLHFSLLSIWGISIALADRIVRLERPDVGATEPYFNPKTLNASVGEQIHFVAVFDQTTKVPCVLDLLTQNFVPFTWSFGESDYSSPCIYNQGIVFYVPTDSGVFSGYFYVDPVGSANGSSFTIEVQDTNPHFFYMVRDWYGNCSYLGTWTSIYGLGPDQDIFFALNPVSHFNSGG